MTYDDAARIIAQGGPVTLPGAPGVYTRWTRRMLMLLIGLIVLLVIGGVTALIIFREEVTFAAGTWFGLAMAPLLFGFLLWWITRALRVRNAFDAAEREPVTIAPAGLTMRGVGPVPWTDVGPAEHRMVASEHETGYSRRAVLMLTPSGLHNVNERLAPDLRPLIGGGTGGLLTGGPTRRYLTLPAVQGMSAGEVMQLINLAHPQVNADPH